MRNPALPFPECYDAALDQLGTAATPALVAAFNSIQREQLALNFPGGDPGEEMVGRFLDDGFGQPRWLRWLDEADAATGFGVKEWEGREEDHAEGWNHGKGDHKRGDRDLDVWGRDGAYASGYRAGWTAADEAAKGAAQA
jgi:hypothetical protein